MPRSEFIKDLRSVAQALDLPPIRSGVASARSSNASTAQATPDVWMAPWLRPLDIDGVDLTEFKGLSTSELKKLKTELSAFQQIAEQADHCRTTKSLINKAQKHLEKVIEMIRRPVLADWLSSQQWMLDEAKEVAKTQGWHFEQDEKEVSEILLGKYKAPRLRIKSLELDAIFDPIARFGGDGRGVVDLVTMPTYETAYYLTNNDRGWWVAPANKNSLNHKPFTRLTLANALSRMHQQ